MSVSFPPFYIIALTKWWMGSRCPRIARWWRQLKPLLFKASEWLENGKMVERDMEDRMEWMYTRKDKVLVRPFYDFLWFSMVWNLWVPTKVGVGVACLGSSLGKVLILDRLQRRRRFLVNRFFLCKENEKPIDYILLHCVKARFFMALGLCSLCLG